MTEINPALALERKIIWCWLAIYICASWLRKAVGEVVSQPSSPCTLHTSVSTELSAARCEPRLSKSWGKEGLQNLSRASAATATSFAVGWPWGGPAASPHRGLALLLCQEQPQRWHCPGTVAGTTASLFFKHWTPQKPPKSCVFNEDYEKKRESKSFIWCQSSPWLLQLIPVYCIFRGLRQESSFGVCSWAWFDSPASSLQSKKSRSEVWDLRRFVQPSWVDQCHCGKGKGEQTNPVLGRSLPNC